EVSDVAARAPTLLVDDRSRLLRVVVVLERPTAGEVDDAGLTGRELLTVFTDDVAFLHRAPDGPGVLEPFLRRDERLSDVLGARVVLVDDRTPPFDHLPLDRYGTRRGRVHDHAKARDVIALPLLLGEVEHADEHGGDELREGDSV